MRLPRFLGFLAAALAATLLPACNKGAPGAAKPRVAFVSNNAASFWKIAEAGCLKAQDEFGVEVVVRMPPQGDPSSQKEILDGLLTQNLKAVAVSVIDPKGQRAYLDEIAAKVPLITQDNDAPASKRLCYIGTNNYLAGREVGKLVKEALPNGGVLAIFVGQLEPLNARQRRQGVLDELADRPTPADINEIDMSKDGETYGKFRLHRTYTDQPVGEQKAKENATDCLTQFRDEKSLCMVGLWAYNPPAIHAAVRDAKRLGEVKIVGFDEDDVTLQGIADGHIHATVVQDPFGFGYESVKMMAALAKGDKAGLPADGIRHVPHRVITKDAGSGRIAVAKFRADLNAILGKK